eukprot:TRINITY_DN10121_c0_g2_i1.p1 TRINITY_DN10121_c0_g2~~TRINITY_DN10121_c0_g2_i1.p1  ORF type:complete len:205 (+),score=49.67 TRINITY_DN10121_c0_g2_i1:18-632(+)
MQGFFELLGGKSGLCQLLGMEDEDGQQVQSLRSVRKPRKVTLWISDMGLPWIPGVGRAVHSSVMIDQTEYEFNGTGIAKSHGPKSHERFSGKPEVVEMGFTTKGGSDLMSRLGDDFPPGTYDLLRKNCNTFSDCALFYLVGQRMEDEHRALEKIGEMLNRYTSVVSALFQGYAPNPKADNFKTMAVIDNIQMRRQRAQERVENF